MKRSSAADQRSSSFLLLAKERGDGDNDLVAAVNDDKIFNFDDFIDDDDDDEEEEEGDETLKKPEKAPSRWSRLNPSIKEKIIREGQERAIRNKARHESPRAKRQRLLEYAKQQERLGRRANRIKRPFPFANRTVLADLQSGQELQGTVISLTPFGAYVDVGTECDGLLHVSQLSRDDFISHPREVLTPGDSVTVRVRSLSTERKKLHLTMLPPEVMQAELAVEEEDDRIALEEIMVDDELWGEIKRVTNFGAYVEVGAVVDGFLHFMDHPSWENGASPRDFMARGDRVRVWASDVDWEQGRLKLTALRPSHLPGPRREITF